MADTVETVIIYGEKNAVMAIHAVVDAQPDSRSQVTHRKNLDGNTAAWIMVASISGQAIPVVLNFVKDYLSSKQVKRIRIADIEIDNPQPEDLERARALMDVRLRD